MAVRFMESPLSFFRMHWDHEPVRVVPSVRCPAFRRSGPAKAGTPNACSRKCFALIGLPARCRQHSGIHEKESNRHFRHA